MFQVLQNLLQQTFSWPYYRGHLLEMLFFKSDQIYYKSSVEVQRISDIIKIISRFRDNKRNTIAARMSRLRATVTASLSSRVDLVHDSREVFMHVPLRTSPLESPPPPSNPCIDLKHLTPNLATWQESLTLPSQEDGRNLRRSSFNYVQTDKLKGDRSLQDKVEEKASFFAQASQPKPLTGAKAPKFLSSLQAARAACSGEANPQACRWSFERKVCSNPLGLGRKCERCS